ncbi:MAG: hypothetical protein AAB316_25100 [Bacteroidota bacterium]
MLPRRVNTLEEVYQEQEKLLRQMDATKDEFLRSLNDTAVEGRQFVLKYVLLPAGIAGAASVAAKQFLLRHDGSANGDNRHNGHGTQKKAVRKENWFFRLMPIVLPLIQQVFLEKKMEKKVVRKMEEEL